MHTETVFHKNEFFSSLYLSESAETNEKQGYIGLFEDSRCNTEKTHIQKLESNSASHINMKTRTIANTYMA